MCPKDSCNHPSRASQGSAATERRGHLGADLNATGELGEVKRLHSTAARPVVREKAVEQCFPHESSLEFLQHADRIYFAC